METISRHDDVISEFISQTGVDAALATDLLQEKSWDLIGALKAYQALFIADVRKRSADIIDDKQSTMIISNGDHINVNSTENVINSIVTVNGVGDAAARDRLSSMSHFVSKYIYSFRWTVDL